VFPKNERVCVLVDAELSLDKLLLQGSPADLCLKAQLSVIPVHRLLSIEAIVLIALDPDVL